MEIFLENKKLQKKVRVEIDDEFFSEAEDLLITIGMDQYKLTNTKSKEDVIREKLAMEFGEDYYESFYKVYSDFGTPNSKATEEFIIDVIKGKLAINPKYEPLLKDKNPELIIKCLVTAFTNYCNVRRKMEERDRAIEDSKLREDVFFDYIMRYKKVFCEAKTIKDLYDNIFIVNQYASMDKRQIYGYSEIFKCLGPFFKWMDNVQKELKEQKNEKPLQEQPFYIDEQYFTQHGKDEKLPDTHLSVVDNVVALLDNLDLKYCEYVDNVREILEKDPESNPFNVYADKFVKWYLSFIGSKDNLEKELKKQLDDQLCDVDGATKQFNKVYFDFLSAMIDLRIKFEIDPRKYKKEADRTIIASQFALIDQWNQQINKSKHNARGQNIDMFERALRTHAAVLKKLCHGEIDSEALLAGKVNLEGKPTAQASSSK